jgi:ankyrin repeat protein
VQADVERVRQLLALGASVTAQDEQGRTALIAAAYQDYLSVTDLLIFHPEEFFGV